MGEKLFVGVDGGGSKTAIAVSDASAVPANVHKFAGCSYRTIGAEAAVTLIADGVRQCLASAGADVADCAGCCIGLPCYGEDAAMDLTMVAALQAALAPIPVHVVNDVEIGWAGATDSHVGIHLVAGTGSIAFGRSGDETTARCGGWVEFFGDEGSCYWIGREAMSLFTKEADGRLPRGALYDVVRQALDITEDFRFLDVILQEFAPYRDKVAHFQRYARQAAEAGDAAVIQLYTAAAQELAQMVGALRDKLNLAPGAFCVSYSGGLFEAGELILLPLRSAVEALGGALQPPRRSAVEGALMLAIEQTNGRK